MSLYCAIKQLANWNTCKQGLDVIARQVDEWAGCIPSSMWHRPQCHDFPSGLRPEKAHKCSCRQHTQCFTFISRRRSRSCSSSGSDWLPLSSDLAPSSSDSIRSRFASKEDAPWAPSRTESAESRLNSVVRRSCWFSESLFLSRMILQETSAAQRRISAQHDVMTPHVRRRRFRRKSVDVLHNRSQFPGRQFRVSNVSRRHPTDPSVS